MIEPNIKERIMNTQISSKLAALGVALMMNSVMLGGVAYLFNSQVQPHTVVSVANSLATVSVGVA
jgi:hypothetical protein